MVSVLNTPRLAVCCSVLQCVAVCRSVLQCIVVCVEVSVLHTPRQLAVLQGSALQCGAVCVQLAARRQCCVCQRSVCQCSLCAVGVSAQCVHSLLGGFACS